MAENVLYADLNLSESTRPRILTVPDDPGSGCTYAEVKVKAQDTNAATNCKSSGKSHCSRKHVAILVVIILILVLAVYLIITYGRTAGSQKRSETLSSNKQEEQATLSTTTQKHTTTLSPTNQEHATTLSSTTLKDPTILSPTKQEDPTTLSHIPERPRGCPTAWNKHGRKCYYFSPEREPKDWDAFRAECTAMGSDLVVIDSREELKFLHNKSKDKYYLLGLRRSPEEQKWKWINHVEHDPAMFNISRPYFNYLCTAIGYGEVHTAPCAGTRTTQNMCEKAATISNRHL
ncbi:C-type lectin domain family 5 member A-like [Melospiza georgiana]|uniref:C-type lectin domain family 5 member A-like n=1 Tax=Melospiza georgiana TaxID=44398 RepID=UPI0025AC47C6|nr:C-type lectin domain family 5 member A-like [Melospiza georgiana]